MRVRPPPSAPSYFQWLSKIARSLAFNLVTHHLFRVGRKLGMVPRSIASLGCAPFTYGSVTARARASMFRIGSGAPAAGKACRFARRGSSARAGPAAYPGDRSRLSPLRTNSNRQQVPLARSRHPRTFSHGPRRIADVGKCPLKELVAIGPVRPRSRAVD